MVKKISFLILSVAILVIGIIAFNRLNYWERSFRIFSLDSDTFSEGRESRGPGGGEFEDRYGTGRRDGFNMQRRSGGGSVRPEMRVVPDSIRARFETKEGLQERGMRERNIPDSLRQPFGPRDGEGMDRDPYEGGMRNGEGRGRGEFSGGKKVDLRNVVWFLAVFASFTVVTIYLDKIYCLIRKGKLK